MVTAAESPLNLIDVSFENYIRQRKENEKLHSVKNIPDYAFPLDYDLHQKLDSIPLFRTVCKTIYSSMVAQLTQEMNYNGVAVGPDQFPEIYRMGADCAHRLGIGIPNIYIVPSQEMNAFTFPADDASPIIVLYTELVERYQNHPGELKSIIAHECGHIHNNHMLYQNVIATLMSGIGIGKLGLLFNLTTMLMMKRWTRAMEVTADRAAIICCDEPQDFTNAMARLMSGAMLNMDYHLNLEALRAQLDDIFNSSLKINEAFTDHPHGIRRIFLGQEFMESDVLYSWRPEWKKPGMTVRPINEINERCQKLVNVLDTENRR